MKNVLLTFTIFIVFVSCSETIKKEKGKVELKLLNQEVQYVAIDTSDLVQSEMKDFESLRTYSDEERKAACNVITFKLVNNSDKKYFFVLDMNDIDFFGSSAKFKSGRNDSIAVRRMCYLVDNKTVKDKSVQRTYCSSVFRKFKNDSMNIYVKRYMQIEGKINMDNYQSFADEASVNHSFVIYPGEYKIFKRKLFLPIDVEKDKNPFFSFSALILSPQYQYDFTLAISASKKDIWKTLHEEQREEIKDNGYEIFDGVIMSNKIPLNPSSPSNK